MKVKVNLSNQTLEYMDSQPYIQGTDSRNVLNVYIEHEDNEVSDIMIAYALQNGRTTIKMSNTGATQETIDDTLYDVYYFIAPKVLTSISGNFVATLIIDVNTSVVGRVNTYKVNVLNTVLNAVEFEAFEDALDDVSSEFIETIEGMSSSITQLQNGKADYQNSSQNILLNSIYKGNERIGFGTNSTIQEFGNIAFREIKDSSGILLLHKYVNGGLSSYEPTLIHTPSSTELYGSSATSTYNIAVHTYSGGLGTSYVLTFTNGLFKFNNYEVIDESKVVDNVTSTDETYPLSAKQGYVLKGLIDNEVTNRQSADGDLQDQINTINGKIGYIELSGSSGTLTTTQLAEAQKPYCILVVSHSSGYSWYYKDSHYTSSYKIKFVEFRITSKSGTNNSSWLGQSTIEVTETNRAWTKSISHEFPTYDSNVIDSKVTNLQSQIDGINAGQNLADIVADLTALNNLDTSKLQSGDKVQVLVDSNHDNASTVYNWNGTIWQYIGAYGMDAYTKAQMDSALALKQNVIDSTHKLSSDLVDDTNKTNKFVTASEKAQITANTNAIAGIKDGTNLDSFSDVETALATKLNTTVFEALGLSVVNGCLCMTYEE